MPDKIRTIPGMSMKLLGSIICPQCQGKINIHGQPDEVLDNAHPIKCSDCRISLNDAASQQLGWKR